MAENIEDGVDKTARFASNLKALAVLAFGVIAAIFVAGIYFAHAIQEVDDALTKIQNHEKELSELKPVVMGLGTLQSDLKKWSQINQDGTRTGLQGGISYGEAKCPDGYYAVGIKTWGSPGDVKFCVGCLIAAQLICKPLNVTPYGQ